MPNKKDYGQFYTKKGMWLKPHVRAFIEASRATCALDPFAGKGDLIGAMRALGFENIHGFDIEDKFGWEVNDSLLSIPYFENTVVVTNPPYFGKSSAQRNRSKITTYFNDNNYVDLYQIAIDRVLSNYTNAVFIIPETYLLSPFFKNYLESITIIEEDLFDDTDCPVCVCCFRKNDSFMAIKNKEYLIYKNNDFLFSNKTLEKAIDKFDSRLKLSISFNDPAGQVGLRGIDGVGVDDKIKFCFPKDLNYDLNNITYSSRSVTVIKLKDTIIDEQFLDTANNILNEFRKDTKDVLLAPFKNNNKEGIRRRRLDFLWARKLLTKTYETLN